MLGSTRGCCEQAFEVGFSCGGLCAGVDGDPHAVDHCLGGRIYLGVGLGFVSEVGGGAGGRL